MKKITFILSLLFTLSTQAAILHVGIGPAYPYNDLSDAYDAASDGDTLKVNSGNWGGLSIYKPITIIGTGYFLEENQTNSANDNGAIFSSIGLYAGSEGSRLIGLYCLSSIVLNFTSNIGVRRCTASYIYIINSDNVIVENNYYVGSAFSEVRNSSNILLNNNYYNNLKIKSDSYAIIKNNTIEALSSASYNSTILNNIILNASSFIFSVGNNNTISHNIIRATANPSTSNPDNNNNYFVDYEVESVCIGYPEQGDYSPDARWQLAPNSPAIGAADDGGDCGMYGGATPYILSGLPPQPIIYELNVPLNADPAGLNVNLKAKTNN